MIRKVGAKSYLLQKAALLHQRFPPAIMGKSLINTFSISVASAHVHRFPLETTGKWNFELMN
jgi:hypothetical protein